MSDVLTYSLEFRGQGAEEGDRLVIRASAPGCTHETRLENRLLVTRFFFDDCRDEALLESQLVLGERGRFAALATVDFGFGNRLWGETQDDGRLSASADDHLRQGTATIHVVGGTGQFLGASGRITSNFVVSDTGEVTDNHLGMLFLDSADATTNAR